MTADLSNAIGAGLLVVALCLAYLAGCVLLGSRASKQPPRNVRVKPAVRTLRQLRRNVRVRS